MVFARRLARGVVGVDNLLAGLAAGDAASDLQSVRQLKSLIGAEPIPTGVYADQFSYRFREFVGIPLRIVRAGLVGVANGHALDVRLFQEVQHDAQTLRAHTDEGDVHFIAGRYVAWAAANVPGNNRES